MNKFTPTEGLWKEHNKEGLFESDYASWFWKSAFALHVSLSSPLNHNVGGNKLCFFLRACRYCEGKSHHRCFMCKNTFRPYSKYMSQCHYLILHQGDVKSQRDRVECTDPTSRKWQSQSFSRAFLPLLFFQRILRYRDSQLPENRQIGILAMITREIEGLRVDNRHFCTFLQPYGQDVGDGAA